MTSKKIISLRRKDLYSYEYKNDWEKFNAT